MKTRRNAFHLATAVFGLLLLSFAGCASKPPLYFNGPALLRIRNETGKNLADVAFQGNNFSNIVAGATTPYQPLAWWPQDPPAIHIDISILPKGETNREHYVWRCARGIHQEVTQPGNWTFALTLQPDLEIKTQEDDAATPDQEEQIKLAIANCLTDLKRAALSPVVSPGSARISGLENEVTGTTWELPASADAILVFGRAALSVLPSQLADQSAPVKAALTDIVQARYVARSHLRTRNGVKVRLYYAHLSGLYTTNEKVDYR